jgi:phenylalanyl-tRNA synthetase beta chain
MEDWRVLRIIEIEKTEICVSMSLEIATFSTHHKKNPDKILAEYSEETHFGLWLCGKRTRKNWAAPESESSIFELKAYVENVLKRLGIYQQVKFETFQSPIFAAGLKIDLRNKSLGQMGIVSKSICRSFDIDTDVYFAELNWDVILKAIGKNSVEFTEIPKFPAVSRDLALLVDKKTTFAEIE